MRRALTALAAVIALASVAHAEPNGDPAKQRAAELAAESSQHYKRGEFEVSAAMLRQAYALSPEPVLLYNLGRSLEGMNDISGAIEAYEGYLEHAKAIDDRGAIERRVVALRIQRSAQHPAAEPLPPLPDPTPPPQPPVVAPKPEPTPPAPPTIVVEASEPSAIPWVVIAAGAVIAGGGGVYGALAVNAHDEAKNEQQAKQAGIYQTDAQNDARYANIGFAVGGGVFVVGVVWEIIERRSHHSAHRVAHGTIRPAISPHGVALEWTFP